MRLLRYMGMAVVALGLGPVAQAAMIQIQLGGVDLQYNGSEVRDADPGSSDPDPLTNATFLVDSVAVGVDTTDVTLDLLIPGVVNIPATGGTVNSAVSGTLDLDLGAGEFLSLELAQSSVSYIPLGASVNYLFVGSVANLNSQNLPYGISLGAPISVSFSTQSVAPVVTSGGYVTEARTAGTGEIQGVPEPASLILLALGGFAALRRR